MKYPIRLFASAAAAAALVLPVHAQNKTATAATPDISGVWKLNRDASDQAPGAPGGQQGGDEGTHRRGGDTDGGGRRGGYGGGGMGRGMRGGGMRGGLGGPGGQRDPEQMKKMRDFMQAVLATPDAVTIAQHDGEISFTDDQGQVTKVQPNGKDEKHVFGSETGKTKTKWDSGQLVMEISPDGNGPKVTRTWSLVQGPDGAKQLQVLTSMEGRGGGRGGRTITRVYDPATP